MISSSGGAARNVGASLGQYEYHEDKGYYVQTSTEQSDEKFVASYLYHDEDDKWWVGDTPGKERRGLRNTRPSLTPPSSGWQWGGGGQSWYDDETLTVTPSLLTLPRQFTVTVTGAAAEACPGCQGVFTRTERWWLGKPVYVNTMGHLLHHGASGNGWMIGRKLGTNVLRGSKARHSPTDENRWRYWTGSEDIPASVTVTRSY